MVIPLTVIILFLNRKFSNILLHMQIHDNILITPWYFKMATPNVLIH